MGRTGGAVYRRPDNSTGLASSRGDRPWIECWPKAGDLGGDDGGTDGIDSEVKRWQQLKKRRHKKGEVVVRSKEGMLVLRWSWGGIRGVQRARLFELRPGRKDSPENRHKAKKLALQIELDIASGTFDESLAKYRPKLIEPSPIRADSTAELWQKWADFKRSEGVSNHTIATRYNALGRHLGRFKTIATSEDAKDFVDHLRTLQDSNTANRNTGELESFGAWCLKQGLWDANLFADIKRAKPVLGRSQTDQPFTETELARILAAFEVGRRAHYYDFTLLLLRFGLRPSEAIGLRWQHVNFDRREITIRESLSRSGEGDQRQRKERKNGVVTVLDLPSDALAMLTRRYTPDAKPDDLIFRSVRGKTINDRNYSRREWRPALEDANIPHRRPYNARHSLASHALDQGASLADAAYLLGHRDTRMVQQVYGHRIKRPKVPELNLKPALNTP